MKKVRILFIITILIAGISSCQINVPDTGINVSDTGINVSDTDINVSDTSSTTSNQENVFLIGDSFLDSTFSLKSELSEENLMFIDEEKVNNKKVESEFDDTEVLYIESWKIKNRRYGVERYETPERSYEYDQNGIRIGFYFGRKDEMERCFPENYDVKTKEIDMETATQLSLEFLGKYENTDQFFLSNKFGGGEYVDYYTFTYIKQINGVEIKSVFMMMDSCGNVFMYKTDPDSEYPDEEVPDLPDEFYIEGAKKRMEEVLRKNEDWIVKNNIVGFKDYKIHRKKLCYLHEFDSYAIDYTSYYTIVYEDGTELESGNQFFYLLNQE